MPRILILAAFGLLALVGGCRPGGDAAPADGAPANLVSVDASGLVDEVDALGASATVVNVWATWCGPCVVEFPELVRYGRDNAARNIAVRFLSIDEAAARPQVEAFLARQGVSGPTYFATTGTDVVQALHPLWTGGIPVTMIFDRDGYVRDIIEGTVDYDYLAARVDGVLAAPPINQSTSVR